MADREDWQETGGTRVRTDNKDSQLESKCDAADSPAHQRGTAGMFFKNSSNTSHGIITKAATWENSSWSLVSTYKRTFSRQMSQMKEVQSFFWRKRETAMTCISSDFWQRKAAQRQHVCLGGIFDSWRSMWCSQQVGTVVESSQNSLFRSYHRWTSSLEEFTAVEMNFRILALWCGSRVWTC